MKEIKQTHYPNIEIDNGEKVKTNKKQIMHARLNLMLQEIEKRVGGKIIHVSHKQDWNK